MSKFFIAVLLFLVVTVDFLPNPEIPVYKPVYAESEKDVSNVKPVEKQAEKVLKTAQVEEYNPNKCDLGGTEIMWKDKSCHKIEVTETVISTPSPTSVATTGCDSLRSKLSALGVSASDIDSAIFISQKESGCNAAAVNPSSGACGEFQSLPCGKWGSPGTDEYLRNAISYAQSRYGGWSNAYSFWITNHWW